MDNTLSYSEYEHLNLEEVCRICFKKGDEMICMKEGNLTDMLLECAAVQETWEDDFYLICNVCMSEINHWNIFRRQVVKSFEIGKWLMQQRRNNKSEQANEVDSELSQEIFESEVISTHNDDTELIDVTTKNDSNISCDNVSVNKKNCDSIKNFECSKCGKCFKQSQTLADHIRRHYDSRNYACELCGKKFYKLFNVTEHTRIHTGERPFKCECCPRTFTRGLLLRNHIKKMHTGEKKFVCNVCSKGFVDGYQLKIHMRTHTGEKPYPCDQCDKAFAMQGQLKSHVKYKHTHEKDYICNICGRAFTAKHTLEEHLRTHSGEKKEPRHLCITCGKKCLTTTQLKIHIRSAHTGERPFPCHICTKSFVTRTSMESHLKTHTGEKSFVCCDCGKAFSAKSSLKIHERIHSGERPFECNHCGKTFTQGSTLKTHLKVHTE